MFSDAHSLSSYTHILMQIHAQCHKQIYFTVCSGEVVPGEAGILLLGRWVDHLEKVGVLSFVFQWIVSEYTLNYSTCRVFRQVM